MNTIPQVCDALQLVLGDVAQEYAVRTGWQRRARGMSGAQFVQTLVFTWMANPQATMEEMAWTAADVGAPVTHQAVSQRFGPASVRLLQGVLHDALQILIASDPVAVPLLQRFPGGVYLRDSTQITLHEDWQDVWRGCGGSGSAAGIKIPLSWDVLHGGWVDMVLTDGRASDSGIPEAPLLGPAVAILDQGFFAEHRFRRLLAQGVQVVIPYKAGVTLTDRHGQRFDWLAWLRTHPTEILDCSVQAMGLTWRLLAAPVSPPTAERKRRHLAAAAHKHQKPINALSWALAEWTIVLTSIPAEQMPAAHILTLMRLRWQIELLYKLWKNEGHVDETRGFNPYRVLTELYAKLLVQVITHWLLLVTCWHLPDRSLVKATRSLQAHARVLLAAFAERARLEALVRQWHVMFAVTCTIDRCAARTATYLQLAGCT